LVLCGVPLTPRTPTSREAVKRLELGCEDYRYVSWMKSALHAAEAYLLVLYRVPFLKLFGVARLSCGVASDCCVFVVLVEVPCGAPCAFLIRIHTVLLQGAGPSQGLALGEALDLVAGEGTLTLFRANGLLSAGDGDGDGDGDEESEDEEDELSRLGDAGP